MTALIATTKEKGGKQREVERWRRGLGGHKLVVKCVFTHLPDLYS